MIISLFSTPVFHKNVGVIDPMTMAWIKNLTYEDQSVAYDNKNDHDDPKNRGMHILNNKKLFNIRNLIKQTVNHYAFDLLKINSNVNFNLQTSWINRTRNIDAIPVHNHNNSHISGVYYLEVSPESSPLHFNKPLSHTNLFHSSFDPGFEEQNMLNCNSFKINPKSGDIIIFPSWLEHWVPHGNVGPDRFSLAFNFYASGTYGIGTEQISI